VLELIGILTVLAGAGQEHVAAPDGDCSDEASTCEAAAQHPVLGGHEGGICVGGTTCEPERPVHETAQQASAQTATTAETASIIPVPLMIPIDRESHYFARRKLRSKEKASADNF
jgi:hypothetical protein